ncbi:fungal-specific transcription factor domain-containing protein [Aspergillus venezuelensis]
MPPEPSGGSYKRSCIRCNQRKVGCDKNLPCSRCLKAGAECVHPTGKRAPRRFNRPPISEIRSHLVELEREVERLRSASRADQQPGSGTADTSNGEETGTPKGRLMGSGGRTWYVGDEASVALTNKIRELNEICDVSSDEADEHASNPMSIPFMSDLGGDMTVGSDWGRTQFLRWPRVQILWAVYRQNVAPMIAFLHIPSIEAIIRENRSDNAPLLESRHEVLLLSICFAAVASMTPQQCLSILGDEQDFCIYQYRLAVEQALAEENLIGTLNLSALQAAVLFLLCLRRFGDSRLIWAEAAIVVRVAQRQGLHRDGQQLGLTPFEIELRRRLWWHVCFLDMLCSEDQGTDTQISPGMFDTKVPININCDELTPQMTSLPSPREGYTDISLCIIQAELIPLLHWAGSSKSLNQDGRNPSAPEREDRLMALANRAELQYLQKFDLDVPVQWVTAVIGRLTLSKAWLVHRLSTPAHGDQTSTATSDESFTMAVEILKFAVLLQNNEATTPWAWLCSSYQQRHVVALILSELCTRPITPGTDNAWELVTKVYGQWQNEGMQSNAMLQQPLSRLMERAAQSRRQKLGVDETVDMWTNFDGNI